MLIDVAARIEQAFTRHAERPALCIGGARHTYAELRQRVIAIHALLDAAARPDEALIGVVATDDLDTYASILAILRSGRAFVPLNPEHPAERNASIVAQAALATVLLPQADAEPGPQVLRGARVVLTSGQPAAGTAELARVAPERLAYLLFTSGSTGEPKGVPISRANLSAFLAALAVAGCAMNERDRVLQMFDLTFDFSIASYLAPLCTGACVHTVPAGTLKFAEVYRLLDEDRLTVAPLVPSVLTYLRPYFDDIDLPELRLSFFCGEALRADVVEGWTRCAPRSAIVNFYGPTEATVFALSYDWLPERGQTKTQNGVVAIGRPMQAILALVVDDEQQPLPAGEQGELCLAGAQLTPGYWQDPAANARAFFVRDSRGEAIRYYRTGDLAICDPDGDFLFCGRVDQQIKLQGYRVELGEIEHHARELLAGHACVVVPLSTPAGAMELRLVVEGYRGDLKAVLASLRERIPSYMVPARAVSVAQLPLNANKKIDRRALQLELETRRE